VVDAIPCAYLVPHFVPSGYIPVVILRISICFERPCALQITCGAIAVPRRRRVYILCTFVYIYIYIHPPLVGHQTARHMFLNKHARKPEPASQLY